LPDDEKLLFFDIDSLATNYHCLTEMAHLMQIRKPKDVYKIENKN
jgi:hypothetical protein